MSSTGGVMAGMVRAAGVVVRSSWAAPRLDGLLLGDVAVTAAREAVHERGLGRASVGGVTHRENLEL